MSENKENVIVENNLAEAQTDAAAVEKPRAENVFLMGDAAGFHLKKGKNCIFIGDGAGYGVEEAENRLIFRLDHVHIDRQIKEEDAAALATLLIRIYNT